MSATVVWAIIGLFCLIAEVFTTHFILIFFGVAALLIALLRLAGLDSLAVELVVFSALSISSLFLFRRKLQERVGPKLGFNIDKNSILVLSADVSPGQEASVDYQGTAWSAINDSPEPMHRGDKVRIVRTEGVKLILTPLEPK